MQFQINLATRLKPVVATKDKSNTPNRPSSRTSSVGSQRSSSRVPCKDRPASADVGQLNGNKKPTDVKYRSRPQSSSSSSNILRLLLSDPITRQAQYTESASEEEISEKIEEFDGSVDSAKESPARASPNAEPLTKNHSQVLFVKSKANTEPDQPDLPGRVSFSSNVFEIDLSESDDSHYDLLQHQKGSKRVHFEKVNGTQMNYQVENSGDDSSSKIIEEYKQEIESLNRKHKEEMSLLNSGDVFDGTSSAVDRYLDTIKETSDSLEIFEQLESVFLDSEAVEQEVNNHNATPKERNLQQTETSKWDSTQATDKRDDTENSRDNSEIDSVIDDNQTLKRIPEKTPKFNVKKPNKALNSKALSRRPRNCPSPLQPQSKPLSNLTAGSKLRKAKSVSNLKEEKHLRDFQMDNIDSWMSMNKETEGDNMRTLMLMKRPQSSGVNYTYNKEWRDTPSSKTDDEGNFSLEEANDCLSSESTTYDELVSIIKEIDADKKVSGKIKDLQADVEFNLNTELQTEYKRTGESDPVK